MKHKTLEIETRSSSSWWGRTSLCFVFNHLARPDNWWVLEVWSMLKFPQWWPFYMPIMVYYKYAPAGGLFFVDYHYIVSLWNLTVYIHLIILGILLWYHIWYLVNVYIYIYMHAQHRNMIFTQWYIIFPVEGMLFQPSIAIQRLLYAAMVHGIIAISAAFFLDLLNFFW